MRGKPYSAISSLESIKLRLSLTIKNLLRHGAGRNKGLESLYSNIPDLLMVTVQSNNDTGRLGVERAGDVQDGLVN